MIKHLLRRLNLRDALSLTGVSQLLLFLILHHLDAFLIMSLLKSQVLICAQTQVSSAQRPLKMWLNKSYFNRCCSRAVSGAPTYGIWLQLVIKHIEPVIVEEIGLLMVMGLDIKPPTSSWITKQIEYLFVLHPRPSFIKSIQHLEDLQIKKWNLTSRAETIYIILIPLIRIKRPKNFVTIHVLSNVTIIGLLIPFDRGGIHLLKGVIPAAVG